MGKKEMCSKIDIRVLKVDKDTQSMSGFFFLQYSINSKGWDKCAVPQRQTG